MHGLLSRGCSVVVCEFLVPCWSVGLAYSSSANVAAKAALLFPVSNLTVPHSHYNSLKCTQAQKHWKSETQNKMHAIEPRVNVINLFSLSRRDEIIIHRLRIRHAYHTHKHLLRGKLPLGVWLVKSSRLSA